MNVLNGSKLKTEVIYGTYLNDGWVRASYLALDVLCVCVGAFLAFCIRFALELPEGSFPRIDWSFITAYSQTTSYLGFLLLYIALIVLVLKNYRLYHTPRGGRFWVGEALYVFKGVSLATLILMVFMYLSKMQISRSVVISAWGLNLIALAGWRYVKHKAVERRLARGDGTRNIVIVGAGKVGYRLADVLEKNRHLGLRVKGFIDDYKDEERVLGPAKDITHILRRHFIDEVFITIPSERDLVKQVAVDALKHQVNVKVIPELFDGVVSQSPPALGSFGDLPVMELHREPIQEVGLIIKRLIDILGALLGIAILSPIMLATAVAVKIDSPGGPIIYRSRRIGKKGQVFSCYKFRTMIPDADKLKDQLRDLNERSGPFFKITKDPRITRLGRFLRKYSLDELPQMFNLLGGSMSLVGPRPHPLDDFEQYSLDHYRRLYVKPGITSLWAVEARTDSSFERNMELDLFYIESWTIWLDVKIILRTIPAVFRGTGT